MLSLFRSKPTSSWEVLVNERPIPGRFKDYASFRREIVARSEAGLIPEGAHVRVHRVPKAPYVPFDWDGFWERINDAFASQRKSRKKKHKAPFRVRHHIHRRRAFGGANAS